MPVIEVRALPQRQGFQSGPVLRQLCTAVAERLGVPLQRVGATWDTLNGYVSGDREGESQEPAAFPPVVSIIAFEGRTPEQIRSVIEGVGAILARELGIERTNLFLTWNGVPSGCLETGGKILVR
jgi:hypothetical protein